MFKNFDELLSLVKGKTNRVVVPGADNSEVLQAISKADEYGLISGGIFIGPKEKIISNAKKYKVNIDKFELVACDDVPKMCDMAVDFIVQGKGDFLLKGQVDTKFYMKAILNKEKGLVNPGALLSHIVLFESSNYKKLCAITDGAILIAPTLEQKAKIIQSAVDTMRMLGIEKPKVSVICPIEKVNPKVQSTVDAAELAKWSREGKIKNAIVEGPYDIYITFSKEKAAEKGIVGKEVPGEADIILLNDLNTANAVYKTVAFFAAGVKAAAIVVGANVPIILPSRTDDPEVKFNSIALCSLLKEKKGSTCVK
ncbi:MAG TPA: phosphate acyltransferase [Elusimicrobiales bacterium]|nr:phosphate acyltransferase [Elusimicrobiales bacterium]